MKGYPSVYEFVYLKKWNQTFSKKPVGIDFVKHCIICSLFPIGILYRTGECISIVPTFLLCVLHVFVNNLSVFSDIVMKTVTFCFSV